MKTILCVTLLSLGLATTASAQGTAPSDPRDRYDRSTTQTVPSMPSDSRATGTMPDKSMGPAATTGRDRGPDGTPGNGSPSKTSGDHQ
jgi:hypothetical protein